MGSRRTGLLVLLAGLLLTTGETADAAARRGALARFNCHMGVNGPICKARTSTGHPLRCQVSVAYEYQLHRRSRPQRRVHKATVDIPKYGDAFIWSWRGKRPFRFRFMHKTSSCYEKGIIGNQPRRRHVRRPPPVQRRRAPPRGRVVVRNDRRYPQRSGSSSAVGGGGKIQCFNGPGQPHCKVMSTVRRPLLCVATVGHRFKQHRNSRWASRTDRTTAVGVQKYGKNAIWGFRGRKPAALTFTDVSLACQPR